ncbi:PIN domain-containing protein [Nocardioides abyssi]|uniref:PIN domain-containing protein n=1 Tax=Nocardioides abyssi TaxID=3058370 RepID=A0ABT8EQL2_9ACTN|nr:PIN domain-containing protein [Nocardioides abyssi]MDN4160425.1 PIN domain-containing protein [Nocardioides abyssi]
MLLTPLPGGRDNLLANLEYIRLKLRNARTPQSSAVSRHKDYLDAIGEGARLLRGQVRPTDIDVLLHTRRYWALVELTVPVNPPTAVTNDLITLEIDDRLHEIDAAIATTREAFDRWVPNAGQLVLPDTSFFLRNPNVLENIDFQDILGSDDTITVLFPLVVIEELDRAKRRRDDARHKAQVALAVLEKHAKDGLSGKWKDAPTSGRPSGWGDIWFDVLLDPPGHVPQPSADAEIIDRAVAVEALAGRGVTLLTYDTSQAFRARGAGIKDVRRLGD